MLTSTSHLSIVNYSKQHIKCDEDFTGQKQLPLPAADQRRKVLVQHSTGWAKKTGPV